MTIAEKMALEYHKVYCFKLTPNAFAKIIERIAERGIEEMCELIKPYEFGHVEGLHKVIRSNRWWEEEA